MDQSFTPKGSGWKRHIWNHHPSSCSGEKVKTINDFHSWNVHESIPAKIVFFLHFSLMGSWKQKKHPTCSCFSKAPSRPSKYQKKCNWKITKIHPKNPSNLFPFHQASTVPKFNGEWTPKIMVNPQKKNRIFSAEVCLTSWWFQPIWKIWVKLDHFPNFRDQGGILRVGWDPCHTPNHCLFGKGEQIPNRNQQIPTEKSCQI